MAKADVLKELVSNGSNLILTSSIRTKDLRELAEIAKESGAKLTISTAIRSDVLIELSEKYGSALTFISGLSDFKKA